MRLLNVNTTQVGNTGSAETNLSSYTLPANTLVNVGDTLRITAIFKPAVNVNTRTYRIYFGGVQIGGVSTGTGSAMRFEALITRTGANSQEVSCLNISGTNATIAATASDLTSPISIQCTGQGVATSDIVQRLLLVELLPTP